MKYLVIGALAVLIIVLAAVVISHSIRKQKNADNAYDAVTNKARIADAVRRVMQKSDEVLSSQEQKPDDDISSISATDDSKEYSGFRIVREIMYTESAETIDSIRTVTLDDNI